MSDYFYYRVMPCAKKERETRVYTVPENNGAFLKGIIGGKIPRRDVNAVVENVVI